MNEQISKAPGRLVSNLAIVGIILASVVFVLEMTLVPLLLSTMQGDLQLTTAQLVWVFNSYSFAVAVFVLIGGWGGDILGARRVFGIGIIVFCLGAAVSAASGSFSTLIAGRIIQGVGGGLFSPLVPVLLTRAMPDKPGKILIIWGSIAGYFAAFAPLLGGKLVEVAGWHAIFALFAVLAVVSLLLSSLLFMPEEKRELTLKRDVLALCRLPKLWLTFGYVFCTYGCITFFLFDFPLLLGEAHYTAKAIGLFLAVMWFSFAAFSTVLRNSVDGEKLGLIMFAAPVLIAAGFVVALLTEQAFALFLAGVAVGAGFACSNAPSTQLVLRIVPDSLRGIATSFNITFARMGGVVVVAALAKVAPSGAVIGVICMALVAVACVFLLRGEFSQGPDKT